MKTHTGRDQRPLYRDARDTFLSELRGRKSRLKQVSL